MTSGYFQSRQELWKEPVYRDVWGLLRDFGDAELASLIAPRALIVEASRGPEIDGPPPETKDRKGATPNGRLATPPLDSVRTEVKRLTAPSKLRKREVVSLGSVGYAATCPRRFCRRPTGCRRTSMPGRRSPRSTRGAAAPPKPSRARSATT